MPFAPLRSATDRSDPGYVRAVAADRALIATSVGDGGTTHALPAGAGLLVSARYPAHEGRIANGPHLRIGLCTGPGSRLVQDIGTAQIEGMWRPGTLTITPPHCEGFSACGPMEMVGLAIMPDGMAALPPLDADRLHGFASEFHRDGLIASVLVALHHEADAHGASTAFFEHGIAVILRRLHEMRTSSAADRLVRPLSQNRYERLLTHVEAHLGDDLAVAGMAAVAGMDPSGLTRALRARTGLAPYAWLTRQRMDHAAGLLAGGMSVTEVAGRVGYANAGKFAAAFRRQQGMRPSRWR